MSKGMPESVREKLARWRAANPQAVRDGLKRFQQKRRELLDELKSVPCKDCGEVFPPVCMDFDHVRGAKKGNVSQMVMRKLSKLEAEIAKCDIVCANCHRIRTHERRK